MKKLLLLLLPLVFFACQGDNINGAKKKVQTIGSAAPPVPPDKATFPREITALTSNFGNGKDVWMFEYYLISPVDSVRSYANIGKWFQFYEDGTFVSGRWQERTGEGTWRLKPGNQYGPLLTLDNINDAEDMEWRLQGMNPDMDQWSWSGTPAFGLNGHFPKVIRLFSIPTKAQFGFTRD